MRWRRRHKYRAFINSKAAFRPKKKKKRTYFYFNPQMENPKSQTTTMTVSLFLQLSGILFWILFFKGKLTGLF